MGRDRRNEARTEHFTKLVRPMIQTPAWRALASTSQALYPWIKLEWRGPDYNNIGSITFSVRQAAKAMGISRNTAGRAFHDLQAKGFIVVTKLARLGIKGAARSPEYELTELNLPHATNNRGRRLYKDWQDGADFRVVKSPVHNPTGLGGKTKPCHQNWDGASRF